MVLCHQNNIILQPKKRERKIKLPFCTLILVLKVSSFFKLLFTLINITCRNFVMFYTTLQRFYVCYLWAMLSVCMYVLCFFHLFRKIFHISNFVHNLLSESHRKKRKIKISGKREHHFFIRYFTTKLFSSRIELFLFCFIAAHSELFLNIIFLSF